MKSKTTGSGITAALIVLVFFASCQIEIPKSIHVKGSPTFEIPIPMGDGRESNSFIKPYVDPNAIREKLTGGGGEETGKLNLYEYTNKVEAAQTYLVTYPLFDMDLDLAQYVNGVTPDESKIPPFEITQDAAKEMENAFNSVIQWQNLGGGKILDDDGNLPYRYPAWMLDGYAGKNAWIDPLGGIPLEIDLSEMKELLSYITFKEEGVTLIMKADSREAAEQLAKAIRIRMPQLKMGTTEDKAEAWVKGKVTEMDFEEDGSEEYVVLFEKTEAIPDEALLLIPGDEETHKIKIELRLVNTVAAGKYTVKFGFNWKTVRVRPAYDQSEFENGAHTGEIEGLDLNSYLKDLGLDEGTTINFATVPAFLFTRFPVEAADELKIEIDGTSEYKGGHTESELGDNIAPADQADFRAKEEWYYGEEVYEVVRYELTDVTSQDKIEYRVTPPETLEIESNIIEEEIHKITAKLILLLPMQFEFGGDPQRYEDKEDDTKSGEYFQVKFASLDEFLNGDTSADPDADAGSDGVMKQLEDTLEENGGTITELKLKLRNIQNAVIEGLFLAVANEPGKDPSTWHIISLKEGGDDDIPLNTESLGSLPQIRFILDANKPLTIKPLSELNLDNAAAFNVNISVVAGISLDKVIDL